MSRFAIRANACFSLDQTDYRINRIHEDGQIVLERLRDGLVSTTQEEDLLGAYGEHRVSAKANETQGLSDVHRDYLMKDLPPQIQRDIKRRRAYVDAIQQRPDVRFVPESMGPLIAEVATEIGDTKPPSVSSVFRWHTRYRQMRDWRALRPRIDRRGSRNVRLGAEVMRLLEVSVDDAFKASPKATGKNIYDRLRGKILQENRQQIGGQPIKCPSLRTVYRLLDRVEAYDMAVLREGKAVADRRFRIAKAGIKTTQILERVEVDHTPLDYFLIDERTWLPLGRPTLTVVIDHYSRILTVVIDHYSRMLLGYYLSFGSPSATAVLRALRHAILPKAVLQKQLPGVTIHHRWPCYGLMDLLALDNGLEFHGNDLDHVAYDLNIELLFCPKRSPWYKGVVERYLKTVNYGFAHQLPGTSMAKLTERGDYDPAKHALMTLSEFQVLFEKWVLDVYAQTEHRGIKTTPWKKWHEGLKRRTLELPADLEQLQRRIGLVRTRSLRNDGITLNNIRYSGEALRPLLRAWGVGVRVKVVFDPEDLGAIQVWGPDAPDPVSVPALDFEYADGLTLTQHEMILKLQTDESEKSGNDVSLIEAKAMLADTISTLLNSRKQRAKRKGGAALGISSSKPSGTGILEQPKSRSVAKNPKTPPVLPDMSPPRQYNTFDLTTLSTGGAQ